MGEDESRPGRATRAIHARVPAPAVSSEPLAPPLIQSASFAFDSLEDMDAVISRPNSGYSYSRIRNPTTAALEQAVADLEGAEDAVAFGSGMAAIDAVFGAMLTAGDHVVVPESVYGGTHGLLTRKWSRCNVSCTFARTADPSAYAEAIRPNTRLLYLETIANPTLEVPDLTAFADLAHSRGLRLVVDSTLATPELCRPLAWGADVVIHSASKYLGGHGDLLAGVVVAKTELLKPIRRHLILAGAACAPFAAWLVSRGLQTLSLRMDRHCASARRLADHLANHAKVARVLYPLPADETPESPAHRFLGGRGGGVVSLVLHGGEKAAWSFADRLRWFRRASGLGEAQSLVLVPRIASQRSMRASERARAGIDDGFVRLSIGLEEPSDLLEDLEQALQAV